jgi:hypothetical protein
MRVMRVHTLSFLALPFLFDDHIRLAAIGSLTSLTHRHSAQKSLPAQAREWAEWWANAQSKQTYQPRDCSGGITPLP